MKKILYIVFTAAAISSLYSCAKESKDPSAVQDGDIRLEATIDPASKTILTSGNKVNWIAGDQISLFDGSVNKKSN